MKKEKIIRRVYIIRNTKQYRPIQKIIFFKGW